MFSFKPKLRRRKNDTCTDISKYPDGRKGSLVQQKESSSSRLECILDERIRRRYQRWCRVCLSEKCRLDHSDSSTASQKTAEDDDFYFHEKLEGFKKKRVALENFLHHIDKLNNCCHLGVLRQPYLPSQKQLPPWLIGVLDKEISLPLIPTFPTSKEAFCKLKSELGLTVMDTSLQDEYMSAASCVRRIRFGISSGRHSDCKEGLTTSTYPVWLHEETSDGTVMEECLQDYKESKKNPVKDESDRNKKPAAVEIITRHGISNSETDTSLLYHNTSNPKTNFPTASVSFPVVVSPLQLLEQSLDWHSNHVCTNAAVRECRDERILIEGSFRTDDFDNLPFKLVLFPGQRSRSESMQVTGTFIRRAEFSSYSLRWRFDADIPPSA